MCWSWSLVCLLWIENFTVAGDSLNIKAAFILFCTTRKMPKVLSMNLDVIIWTPRHPFRLLGTGLAPKKGSILQDSCPAQHCKTATYEKLWLRILFWSWLISEQLALIVFQRTNCPRLPSPEICWQMWALSYGNGWYEHSLSTCVSGSWLNYNHHGSYHQSLEMRTLTELFTEQKLQVSQRDAFSSVQFQTALKPCVELPDLSVRSENRESRVCL